MLDEILEIHADDRPHTGPVSDEMTARNLMIEAERLARKVDLIERTQKAIAAQYAARVEAAEKRIAEIRQQLQLYIEMHGPVSFDEIGQAFLSKRKEKVIITDEREFAPWALEKGEMFAKPMAFDKTAAQRWALDYLHRTGEVPPGAEYQEEGFGLTIRGPKVQEASPDE